MFDALHEVKRVAKKWSEKVPNLVTLSDTASGMPNLRVGNQHLSLFLFFLLYNLICFLFVCIVI